MDVRAGLTPAGPDGRQQGLGRLGAPGQGAQHHEALVGCGDAGLGAQRRFLDALARGLEQVVAPRCVHRLAAGPPHRGQHALSIPAQGAVEQSGCVRVVGVEHAALQPQPRQFDLLLEAPLLEGFVRGRQSEGEQVPADHLGSRCQFETQVVDGAGGAVGNGLQRQPFQPRVRGHPCHEALLGRLACAAIEARGARRGDQCMGPRRHVHRDVQLVTSHDAPGRVHEDVVADARAFRMQAGQHPQRAVVAVVHDGAGCLVAVVQGQMAVPAHGKQGRRPRRRKARSVGAAGVRPSRRPHAAGRPRPAVRGRSPRWVSGAVT
jgi:hypothetical protein